MKIICQKATANIILKWDALRSCTRLRMTTISTTVQSGTKYSGCVVRKGMKTED